MHLCRAPTILHNFDYPASTTTLLQPISPASIRACLFPLLLQFLGSRSGSANKQRKIGKRLTESRLENELASGRERKLGERSFSAASRNFPPKSRSVIPSCPLGYLKLRADCHPELEGCTSLLAWDRHVCFAWASLHVRQDIPYEKNIFCFKIICTRNMYALTSRFHSCNWF